MSANAVLIGLDWGTSKLRIMRIAEGGSILDTRSDPRGAGRLSASQFAAVLSDAAGDWLDKSLPILACGMIGARSKWHEVQYVSSPASLVELAAGLASPADRPDLAIVPGVRRRVDGQTVDVMRGEETQVMGLNLDGPSHTVVAPGTHSKWIEAAQGLVLGHRTFMTGDLFEAIRAATILGAEMGEPGVDPDAFAKGVTRGLREPALTAALFSVRVEGLTGRLNPEGSADYLSGVLIGAEIAAQSEDRHGPVTVVGTEALSLSYAKALSLAGYSDIRLADATETTARGLWRIHAATRP